MSTVPITKPHKPWDAWLSFDRTLPGPIVADRVRPGAVRQGTLGSCFFLAPAAAVAQRRPDLIRRAFTELPDGTVEVRLFEHGPRDRATGKPTFTPTTVRITRDVPSLGGPLFARPGDEGTWPLLLEKAYAAMIGGYDKVHAGGLGKDGLEALTGRPAEELGLQGGAAPATFAKIEAAIRAGSPITIASTSGADFRLRLRALVREAPGSDAAIALRQAGGVTGSLTRAGIVPLHEYTVLGVGTKDGKKHLVLRNPWGRFTPPRAGLGGGDAEKDNNGVFALPLEHVAQLFDTVAIADLGPAPGAESRTLPGAGGEPP